MILCKRNVLKRFSYILSFVNMLIPKCEKQISIYGRRMLNDNADALLCYLIDHNYNQKYKIYIILHESVSCEKYQDIKNVFVCTDVVKTFWVILRSLYIFHTQGMSICTMYPANGQIIFNLWHGSPLKSVGRMSGKTMYPKADSYFLSASPFFSVINEKCFGHTQKQMFIGSNPRNDLLLNPKRLDVLYSIGKGKKILLFMPTYRKSNKLGQSDSDKDFPIIGENNIAVLDAFLENRNILFIIKPHPYQNKVDFLKKSYKNILVMCNDDLNKLNVKLYELLACADALITDFSSVYFDYLLLDRPICFAIDDMSSYENNRGYTIENPLELMPGCKIRDLNELEMFIINFINGYDIYKEDRCRVNALANTYKTPDASQRILDFVGINK